MYLVLLCFTVNPVIVGPNLSLVDSYTWLGYAPRVQLEGPLMVCHVRIICKYMTWPNFIGCFCANKWGGLKWAPFQFDKDSLVELCFLGPSSGSISGCINRFFHASQSCTAWMLSMTTKNHLSGRDKVLKWNKSQ